LTPAPNSATPPLSNLGCGCLCPSDGTASTSTTMRPAAHALQGDWWRAGGAGADHQQIEDLSGVVARCSRSRAGLGLNGWARRRPFRFGRSANSLRRCVWAALASPQWLRIPGQTATHRSRQRLQHAGVVFSRLELESGWRWFAGMVLAQPPGQAPNRHRAGEQGPRPAGALEIGAAAHLQAAAVGLGCKQPMARRARPPSVASSSAERPGFGGQLHQGGHGPRRCSRGWPGDGAGAVSRVMPNQAGRGLGSSGAFQP